MKGDEPIHWMTGAGIILVLLSVMLCVTVFSLPVFEGRRTEWFWFVAVPAAIIGGGMVLYRLRQNRPS